MTSIQSQSLAAGSSSRQNALSDSQFSSYVKKQSYSAYESLDAGLTIKTKEGDLVTLSSNSYSKLDAFMYNSKGILQTETGKVAVTQNQREITLASGESFSFSVEGNLSEEELQDIESIVKGIDEIISEMAEGDMDDAVATALSMGGYDSIAAYAADITYEKSYAMTSEIQAKTIEPASESVSEPAMLPQGENAAPAKMEPFPENRRPWKNQNNSIENLDKFVEKMGERIEKLDEKLMEKAQKPIDKLFRHHLGNMKENRGEERSLYNAVENAGNRVDKMIDKITGKLFKDQLSAFLE